VERGCYEYTLEQIYEGQAPLEKDHYPVTEAYARHLEKWIQANPADYLWSHKRWKHKKPAEVTT
ncbi:MAG TPA: hypothetical protein VK927_07165, partial [Adhaeribacter sp.]|nr:hypothetical protein [Adhaeribacter sp.]